MMARIPLSRNPTRSSGKKAAARKRRPGAKKKSVVKKAKTSAGRDAGGKKVHWKVPGFDAFSPHNAPIKRLRKGQKPKLVPCGEIAEPEKGIHSLQWAASIVSQNTGFLKLPFEVRLKIYIHAIHDLSSDYIEPRKKLNKFWSPGWPSISQETTKFYQLSRQVYVDFVGSSLLYRHKPFYFNSPNLMLNYLYVINPLHKNAIRSIKLRIVLRTGAVKLPDNALLFLNSCESLQHLSLRFQVMEGLFILLPIPPYPFSLPHNLKYSIDQKVLDNIRRCETLKSIKGLKTFDLEFLGPNRYVSSFKQTDELGKFEEEMRGLMIEE